MLGGIRATSSAIVLVAMLITPGMADAGPPRLGSIPGECTVDPLLDDACEYSTRLGVFTISPRIAVAGGSITGSFSSGCMIRPPFADPERPCYYRWEGFTASFRDLQGREWPHSPCTVDTPTCTITIPQNVATRPFGPITAAMQNEQGVGMARRWFAILGGGSSVIQGTVRNAGTAVKGAVVHVGSATLRTDAAGFYWTTVTKGRSYVVSADNADACVVGAMPCRPQTTVTGGGAKTVDFTIEPRADLSLRFEAGQQGLDDLGNRTLRLRLTIKNAGKLPVSNLTVSAVESSDSMLQVTSGPSPTAPAMLDPGRQVVLGYRATISGNGTARLLVGATGTDPMGATLESARAIDLVIDDKNPLTGRTINVVSSFDALLSAQQDRVVKRRAALMAQLNAGLPQVEDGSVRASLEDWAGLPRGSFGWMPTNSDQAIAFYDRYTDGQIAGAKQVATSFSVTIGDGFSSAFEFWLGGGRMSQEQRWALASSIPGILSEGAGTVGETAGLYARTSYKHLSGKVPLKAYESAMRDLDRDIWEGVSGTVNKAADDFRASAVKFQADYQKNPDTAVYELGRAHAQFEAKIVAAIAVELLTDKGLGPLMKALGEVRVIPSSRFLADGLEDGIRGAFAQRRGLAELGDGVLSLDEAAAVSGIPAEEIAAAQGVMKDLAAKGVKDPSVAFTPSNPLSSGAVRAGTGVAKQEFQTGSTITKLDLLLGCAPEAGGKYAVYRPRWPSVGKDRFLAMVRRSDPDGPALVQRWFAAREKQYAAAVNGTHPIAQAAQQGGANFTMAGNKSASWEVTIEKFGNTWVPRNKSLTIDGAVVGKEGSYTLSDLDGHMFAQSGGANVNPLALKQQLTDAGLPMAEHGFTVNAWDLDATNPRDWVTYYKYQLAQLPAGEARQLAQKCADSINERFRNSAWFEKRLTADDLLATSMTDKVITVTGENIIVGHGPRPKP